MSAPQPFFGFACPVAGCTFTAPLFYAMHTHVRGHFVYYNQATTHPNYPAQLIDCPAANCFHLCIGLDDMHAHIEQQHLRWEIIQPQPAAAPGSPPSSSNASSAMQLDLAIAAFLNPVPATTHALPQTGPPTTSSSATSLNPGPATTPAPAPPAAPPTTSPNAAATADASRTTGMTEAPAATSSGAGAGAAHVVPPAPRGRPADDGDDASRNGAEEQEGGDMEGVEAEAAASGGDDNFAFDPVNEDIPSMQGLETESAAGKVEHAGQAQAATQELMEAMRAQLAPVVLEELRRKKDALRGIISYYDLAYAMGQGDDDQYAVDIFEGRRRPTVADCTVLHDKLGVPLVRLLFGLAEPNGQWESVLT